MKIYFKAIELEGIDSIDQDTGREKWRALLYAVMKILTP